MITPADMARMMANASGKRAQNGKTDRPEASQSITQDIEPDALLYSSASDGQDSQFATRLDGKALNKLEDILKPGHAGEPQSPQGQHDGQGGHGANGDRTDGGKTTNKAPTPALMARTHQVGGSATFASLDAQELPAVREYSAGGLIFDDNNRVAVIARHSRSGHLEWCLPKGHIEKGETPEQTAVREIHEETGILGEVVSSIATTDYWFTGTEERVHKLVHHFALRMTGGFLTVEGDPDHEAEDTKWVDFDDLDNVLSYPNERKIVWLYARKMNRQRQ